MLIHKLAPGENSRPLSDSCASLFQIHKVKFVMMLMKENWSAFAAVNKKDGNEPHLAIALTPEHPIRYPHLVSLGAKDCEIT